MFFLEKALKPIKQITVHNSIKFTATQSSYSYIYFPANEDIFAAALTIIVT